MGGRYPTPRAGGSGPWSPTDHNIPLGTEVSASVRAGGRYSREALYDEISLKGGTATPQRALRHGNVLRYSLKKVPVMTYILNVLLMDNRGYIRIVILRRMWKYKRL